MPGTCKHLNSTGSFTLLGSAGIALLTLGDSGLLASQTWLYAGWDSRLGPGLAWTLLWLGCKIRET